MIGSPTRAATGPVCHLWFTLAVLAALSSCTTARRAAGLVIDHHVGMARQAVEVVSGKAEEREKRIAALRSQLEASRAAIASEEDPQRLIARLKEHVVLQDALLAELSGGHHGHGCGMEHAHAGTEKAGEAARGDAGEAQRAGRPEAAEHRH